MEILFYNAFSLKNASGPEHWLLDVCPRLQRLGNKVTIVCPACAPHEERLSDDEIRIRLGTVNYEEFSCIKFPKLSSTPIPTHLLETFAKKADVIYFLNGFALQDVFVTLDKMLTKTPTICGLHGPVITTYGLHNFYASIVFKRNLRLFNACHALNPSYVELMHNWGIINVYLIPNGVDTHKFQPIPDLKGNKFKVLFIGRFVYEKGIDILCKAIDILNRDETLSNALEFTLIGRGPLSLIVQRTAARFPNVVVENFVDEGTLAKVYSSHHLFTLPARFETFPLPPLEAQACGLPVVTTNIPGTREQVTAGSGSVIQEDNAEALAGEIRKYYELWYKNPRLFQLRSVAARNNVLENFALDKAVSKINNMMAQIAVKRKQNP